jgi:hypothetical protein
VRTTGSTITEGGTIRHLKATGSTITRGGTIKGSAITQSPQARPESMPGVCTSHPYSHLPGDDEEGPQGRDSEGAQEERPTKRATPGSKGVKGEEVSASDGYTPQNSEEMVVVRGQEGMFSAAHSNLTTLQTNTNTAQAVRSITLAQQLKRSSAAPTNHNNTPPCQCNAPTLHSL